MRRTATLLCIVAALAAPAARTQDRSPIVPTDPAVQAKLLAAVVTVNVHAVANARSNAELGRERTGTGIVVDQRGLVATSVFLVQEADSIIVTTADGRSVPAVTDTADHSTGVAILRPAAALGVTPMPLGVSAAATVAEPVLVISAAGPKEINLARVVAKRDFAASWEYLVDGAIFTAPPVKPWAGAALVDGAGRLIGIGSLLLDEQADRSERAAPSNLFVPVDLYRAALEQLARGEKPPRRPWLGLMTERVGEHLVVVDVPPESPASRAGIRAGDAIVAVNGDRVATHAALYRTLWRQQPDRAIRLTIERESRSHDILVQPVDARDGLIQRA